eukprot:TRINITY_DN4449_c0_g1_i1.p1 TRINITY_DN4449_c0_g1~~TRINITY_DN4449_c0_g1_i1.p1  ORF type:complete len:94 (-),score=3.23 TRINITY_DN4449_c0_g1_i1:192-473(-)
MIRGLDIKYSPPCKLRVDPPKFTIFDAMVWFACDVVLTRAVIAKVNALVESCSPVGSAPNVTGVMSRNEDLCKIGEKILFELEATRKSERYFC